MISESPFEYTYKIIRDVSTWLTQDASAIQQCAYIGSIKGVDPSFIAKYIYIVSAGDIGGGEDIRFFDMLN